MNKELIIRSSSSKVDFALLNDGKLIELHKEENSENQFNVGDIFLAKKLSEYNRVAKDIFRNFSSYTTEDMSHYNSVKFFRDSSHPTVEFSNQVMQEVLEKHYKK